MVRDKFIVKTNNNNNCRQDSIGKNLLQIVVLRHKLSFIHAILFSVFYSPYQELEFDIFLTI